MLFAHPDVFSCPETFFFIRAINGTGRRHRLGLASAAVQPAFATLVELGLSDRRPPVRRLPRRESTCARWFTAAMDSSAAATGARLWVEKTPGHLTRIDTIQRHVPRARFIHMIREGEPTVASLYDVTQRYPDWDGPRSLEACARRWSRDIAISADCAQHPGHAFVSYERLVAEPERVLRALCGFLALELDPDGATLAVMIQRRARATAGVSRSDERWKTEVGGDMRNRNAERIERLFDDRRRALVRELVSGAEAQRERLPFL